MKFFRIIVGMYTFGSLHLFRLFFCKLFKISGFHASATVPNDFLRPLRLYTRLYVVAILAPSILLNALASLKTNDLWTNQLQMTMLEMVILGIILAGLLLFEYYCQSPRNLLHRPSDENPFFIGLFKDESINKVEVDEGKKKKVDDATYWQIADKSIRHEKLQDVLRTVKCHVDLMLNNKFDTLINKEIGGEEFEEKLHNSCPDMQPGKDAISPDPDDDILNVSFPGLN